MALLACEVRVDGTAEGEKLRLIDVAAAFCVGEPEDLAQLRVVFALHTLDLGEVIQLPDPAMLYAYFLHRCGLNCCGLGNQHLLTICLRNFETLKYWAEF